MTGSIPFWIRLTLLLCLTLSGAAGLAYQVLWVRQLSFVLGGSSLAISTIIATFFAGLGLGGYLGGKIADKVERPLVAYAIAEVGIAVTALATPFLLTASGSVYLGLYQLLGGDPALVLVSRILATALLLLIPTTLMGASLPFISRYYIRSLDRLGRGLGLLYGMNTLGGVLGCAFVGYYAILEFGVRTSFFYAVGANLVAALGAFLIHVLTASKDIGHGVEETRTTGGTQSSTGESSTGDSPAGDSPAGDSPTGESSTGDSPASGQATSTARPSIEPVPGWIRTAYIGFFLSGLTSIAYEVLWTRALNFAIGNSVYAYTTILAVFLAGLVPGALLAGWLADRSKQPMRTLGWIQLLTAAAVLALYTQAPKLPGMTSAMVERFGAGTLFSDVITKVLPTAAALFLPAVIIGLTFPFVLRVVGRRISSLGRSIGDAYAVNTVGGIIGSLLGGYILLPTVGVTRGILIVVGLNLILAALFFRHGGARVNEHGTASSAPVSGSVRFGLGISLLGAVVALAAAVWIRPAPFITHTAVWERNEPTLVWHEEGHTATVAVTDLFREDGTREHRELHINLLGASIIDDESFHQQYYASISLIPILLHSDPGNVFVAGLASGVTAGAAGLDPRTDRVTCVEISPEVIEAAQLHFEEDNYGAHSNPKIEILADDARAYLVTTEQKYDILITDVFLSAVTGTSGLYSLDYFNLCRSRLAEGGIMSVGVGNLQGTDRTVARTFCESFPHVLMLAHPDRGVYNRVFLLGSNEPFEVSRSSVEQAFRGVMSREMKRYGIESAEDLVSTYICNREELLSFVEDAPLCTDDRPVIDFYTVAWAEGFVTGANEARGGPGAQIILRKSGGLKPLPNLVP